MIGPTVGMLKRRARLLCQENGLAKLRTPLEYLECWSPKPEVKHPWFISGLVLAIGSSSNSGILQGQGMARLCP